jgi:uncharacterized protein YdeI (YjbR/CyaY-like superfamily)
MDPKVSEFYNTVDKWKEELNLLRGYVLETELKEEYKWKQPCYTLNGKNVIMVSAFKDNPFVSFLKGELLKDKYNKLVSPGKNSQITKLFKFNSVEEIKENETIIKAYINEAIENEKKGLKVKTKAKEELVYIDELVDMFEEDEELKEAFEKLTPGRKRAYNIYFGDAKYSETRTNRILKYRDKILDGKGMNDWK